MGGIVAGNPFSKLDGALYKLAYDQLVEEMPGVASGITEAVVNEETPQSIHNRVKAITGNEDLANRCAQAATYVQEFGG